MPNAGAMPDFLRPYRKPGFRHDGFLVAELVKRDFKARYDRSVLGMFWCVLQPTLTMGLLYAVFSLFFKSAIPNFPLYLISGIVFYQFFTETTSSGLQSIRENAALIAKVKISVRPRKTLRSSYDFGLQPFNDGMVHAEGVSEGQQ